MTRFTIYVIDTEIPALRAIREILHINELTSLSNKIVELENQVLKRVIPVIESKQHLEDLEKRNS